MDENNNIERRFYVAIRHGEKESAAEVVYFKNDMTFQFFIRWKWYFEYREALIRVRNPRSFVRLSHGSYEFKLPEDVYKKKIKDLLSAAKRKRTEFQRKIDYARENWNELFPIDEHPKWIKVEEKLKRYEDRVEALSKEYYELQDVEDYEKEL